MGRDRNPRNRGLREAVVNADLFAGGADLDGALVHPPGDPRGAVDQFREPFGDQPWPRCGRSGDLSLITRAKPADRITSPTSTILPSPQAMRNPSGFCNPSDGLAGQHPSAHPAHIGGQRHQQLPRVRVTVLMVQDCVGGGGADMRLLLAQGVVAGRLIGVIAAKPRFQRRVFLNRRLQGFFAEMQILGAVCSKGSGCPVVRLSSLANAAHAAADPCDHCA
jgi:hypothetical protein